MSGILNTFEVEMRIKVGNPHYKYYPVQRQNEKHSRIEKGIISCDSIVKMFHIKARTSEKAAQRAKEKYAGQVLRCQKVKPYEGLSNIEKIELNPPSVYQNGEKSKAKNMDEMVWKKKDFRHERKDRLND